MVYWNNGMLEYWVPKFLGYLSSLRHDPFQGRNGQLRVGSWAEITKANWRCVRYYSQGQYFWNALETSGNERKLMKIKLLVISAVIFLLLGWNTKDGVLFFFFAVHLFTLTIGLFLSRYDQKRRSEWILDTLPIADSSES